MESDEIEEFYSKKIEEADKFYRDSLNNPENKLSKKEIKKKYDEMFNKALKEYREKYKKFLKKQKKNKKKNILKKKEKEADKKLNSKEVKETKPFKVKKLDLELGWKEKLKLKYDMFKFKGKIKLRNISRKVFPPGFLRIFLKIKSAIKYFLSTIKRYINTKIKDAGRKFTRFKEGTKKKSKRFVKEIKHIKKKIGIKAKKSEKKSKDSKEEGEGKKEERPDEKKLREMEEKENSD